MSFTCFTIAGSPSFKCSLSSIACGRKQIPAESLYSCTPTNISLQFLGFMMLKYTVPLSISISGRIEDGSKILLPYSNCLAIV